MCNVYFFNSIGTWLKYLPVHYARVDILRLSISRAHCLIVFVVEDNVGFQLVRPRWCRTHFFTTEQCQETCYGLWADSLISVRWRFPNWLFFGSEPISGGVRTAWSRWHLDEIINCGRMAQLISHSLSVASLPYATLTFIAILRSRNNRHQVKISRS